MISKQNEIFNKPVDERLQKITDLDQKVNSDDLIYRYKGIADDVKFDELIMILVLLIRYEMVKQN